MTPEQKQQILYNAPEGARFYSKKTGLYYALNSFGVAGVYDPESNAWIKTDNPLNYYSVVRLDSLREQT